MLTNTGNQSLTNVAVTDPLLAILAGPTESIATDSILAVTETFTYTGSYAVTQADIDTNATAEVSDTVAGTIDNLASSTTTELPIAQTDDEHVPLTQNPAIGLVKSLQSNADEDGSDDVSVGDTLTYQFVATNTGNVTLTGVTITDPLPGLSALSCTPTQPATLNPDPDGTDPLEGEQMSCTATYVVTAADVAAGSIDNTATAGSDQTPDDTDDESVDVPNPVLKITKTNALTDDADGSGDVSVGDTITYSYSVKNTGSANLTNVTVEDDKLGDRFGALEVFSMDLQDVGLVSLGGTIEYQYTITNPNEATVDNITVTDDQLGVIASGLSLATGESTTLFATTEIFEDTANTVTVTSPQCALAEASATVTVNDPLPPGVDSCVDGKPRELVFEYTGEPCSATTNYQEGKFDCSDPQPLSGDFPVQLVLTLTGNDAGKVTVSPTAEVVTRTDPNSNTVTFTATGSRLPSNTSFDIRQDDVTLQSLNIHTSCSAPLAVGDKFGGVVLIKYVPEP